MGFRDLPGVETLLTALRERFPRHPESLLKAVAQQAVADARDAIRDANPPIDTLSLAVGNKIAR